MTDTSELKFILHEDGTGKLRLWACRGEGKGCARNKFRDRKKPCEDCYGPCDENITLAELQQRLTQGN